MTFSISDTMTISYRMLNELVLLKYLKSTYIIKFYDRYEFHEKRFKNIHGYPVLTHRVGFFQSRDYHVFHLSPQVFDKIVCCLILGYIVSRYLDSIVPLLNAKALRLYSVCPVLKW